MKYIVVKNDSLTQEMLDLINGEEVTAPTPIYIVEPDIDSGTDAVFSGYSYITTEEEFPNGFANFKKLTEEQYNEIVTRIKSGQSVQNKVESKSPEINAPFASKEIDGKKLFTRIHGISASVQNAPDNIDFTVPYNNCKINGIEILAGGFGDKANFKVLDTPSGTISGVPNYLLNQFAFDVNITKDFYRFYSPYDADLIKDMTLRIEYDAKDELLPKTIYINLILHEVK